MGDAHRFRPGPPSLVALGVAEARAPLAQLVEQLTLNQRVGGSSPSWRTDSVLDPGAQASLRVDGHATKPLDTTISVVREQRCWRARLCQLMKVVQGAEEGRVLVEHLATAAARPGPVLAFDRSEEPEHRRNVVAVSVRGSGLRAHKKVTKVPRPAGHIPAGLPDSS